ncbi:MAG TPA: alanine racemase [Bauldia sp.]|nr:alanine racemase [Bauldia sp.]
MTKVHDLDTPVATIDLDRLEKNIVRGQAMVAAQGLANRPHIKTHKIPDIARMQIRAGASGITCQKLSEAEVFIDANVADDVLITFNIVGEKKTEHLMRLSDRVEKLSVVADNEDVIRGLSSAGVRHGRDVPILIENDVGFGRNGVQSPEAALSLARYAMNMPRIKFEGLMAFPTVGETAARYLNRAVELFKAEGIPLPIVSGGGTPALMTLADFPMLTEHRAGTYVFNDVMMVHSGYASWDECALTVRATVVSLPTGDRGIIDAGSKALTREQYYVKNFGKVVEYPGAIVANMSEEHGVIDFSGSDRRPKVGEVVNIVPNHCCVCINMHDKVYGIRGEEVEIEWPVAARGKLT